MGMAKTTTIIQKRLNSTNRGLQYLILLMVLTIGLQRSQYLFLIRLFYYKKNMRSNTKLANLPIPSKKSLQNSSSTLFRTIFKCRNNTIIPPQHQQTSKSVNRSKSSSRIEVANDSCWINKAKPTENTIKDYVKLMKTKIEDEFGVKQQSKDRQFIDMKASRVSSRSNLSNTLGPIHKSKPIPLEQIQKRVENLLAVKLQRLNIFKEGVGVSTWQYLKEQNCLQPQLQDIISKLKSGQQSEEGISQICSKLQMLEKIIASQAIQSQLLKNRYYGYKNQRSNISSHKNVKLLSSSSLMNDLKVNLQKFKLKTQGEFLSNSTSNRQAYSKPSKQFYLNDHYKYPVYTPNRQLLQRSLYSTDFLHYGTMPTFINRPADEQSLPSHVPLTVKATKYQQQFKDKSNLLKTINFKELDCYKNKFKNPNISFMNNCKKKMLASMSSIKQKVKVQKENMGGQGKLSKILAQSTFTDFYKSQQKRNYLAHSSSQQELTTLMKSKPKDGRLREFKHQLRKSYLG